MASKKKGLSLEEKRSRMMDIFFETKDVFLLKDLEKVAPKQKGITLQSVKDVVQSLVDDDMVDSDKIGTSVYFWAFPSKATANRKRKLDSVKGQLDTVKKRLKSLDQELAAAGDGKQCSADRKLLLDELIKEQTDEDNLKAQLKEFSDNDPELMGEITSETALARVATNRWTDNIFSTQQWVKNKYPSIDQETFGKQFGIPEDLDYIS